MMSSMHSAMEELEKAGEVIMSEVKKDCYS